MHKNTETTTIGPNSTSTGLDTMQDWRPDPSGSGFIFDVSECQFPRVICYEILGPDGFQTILVREQKQSYLAKRGGILRFNETYVFYRPPFVTEDYPVQTFLRVPWDHRLHPDMYDK